MIETLNIISFGKFKNKTIHLTDNINIIYGENEAGKSTIGAFIKAILYGFNKGSRKINESDRIKYRPWSDDEFIGSLIYNHQSRRYLITRKFKKTNAQDILSVVDYITGEEIKEFSEEFANIFFNISLDTFENTSFIKQGSLHVKNNDELIKKMTNLITSANEEHGYHQTLKVLEQKKSLLYKGKSGQINKLEQEIEGLSSRYHTLNNEYLECIKKEEELKQINIQIESLSVKQKLFIENETIELLQKDYSLYNQYLKINDNLLIAKEKRAEYLEFLQINNKIIDYKTLEYLKHSLDEYQISQIRLNESSKVNDSKLEEVRNIKIENDYIRLKDLENIIMQLDKAIENNEIIDIKLENLRNKNTRLLTYTISILIMFFALYLLIVQQTLFAFIPLIISVVVAIAGIILPKDKRGLIDELTDQLVDIDVNLYNESVQEKNKILNGRTLNDVFKEYDEYNKSLIIHEANTNNLKQKQKNYAEIIRISESKFNTLINDLSVIGYLYQDIKSTKDYLNRLENIIIKFNQNEEYIIELTNILEGIIANNDIGKLRELSIKYENYEQSINSIDNYDYSKDINKLVEEKIQVETLIQKFYPSKEEKDDLKWSLDQKNELLKELYFEYDAINIAINKIEEVMKFIQLDFAPKLTSKVGYYLDIFTDGKYKKLMIDQNYNIKIIDDNNVFYELAYFSIGTIDQVYLAFRMALIDIVDEDEKMPVIFDDSFANHDDKRLSLTLEHLVKVNNRQTLIFTCHKREIEILKNTQNVNYIEL